MGTMSVTCLDGNWSQPAPWCRGKLACAVNAKIQRKQKKGQGNLCLLHASQRATSSTTSVADGVTNRSVNGKQLRCDYLVSLLQ